MSALVSLAIQAPIATFGLSEPTELPEIAASASAAVILAVLFAAAALLRGGVSALRLFGAWVSLSALATLVLAWPLEPTKHYYGGVSIDQMFRLQYLTRLAEFPGLADMNYVGLPPFYPAGWFWVGGRFADLFGLPAWLAFKPYALLTIAVTSVGAFTLWSVVVRRRIAVLLAVVTTIAGFLHGIDEPYAWMSAAWLPPVAVIAWQALSHHRHRAATVGIGLFLGFTAITYTLYLAFSTLVVIAMAVVIAVRERTQRAVLRRLVARVLAIGLVSGGVALLVWTPFLAAKLDGAASSGAANQYLPLESMPPLPMFEPTPFGALCLVGLAWTVLACRRSALAAGLLVLLGCVYSWFGLSTVAIAAHTTLLAFRTTTTLNVLLGTAGVLGLLELWWFIRDRLDRRYLTQATALAVLLGLGGGLASVHTALTTSLAAAAQPAYHDYYPTGQNAQRQSDPAHPGAWNDDILSAINDLTGRRPSEVVLLTAYYPILSFAPYWGFQQETAHYANPMANFDARSGVIRQWASATRPEDLRAMLKRSPFPPPNAFLFQRGADGYHLTLSHNAFPHQPNVQIYDVRFDPAVFDSPAFVRRDVGPFVVIAVR